MPIKTKNRERYLAEKHVLRYQRFHLIVKLDQKLSDKIPKRETYGVKYDDVYAIDQRI